MGAKRPALVLDEDSGDDDATGSVPQDTADLSPERLVRLELARYYTALRTKGTTLLQWWAANAAKFPILAKCAPRFLSV